MVSTGDTVVVDGITAVVLGRYGMGTTAVYTLDDGRKINDLDKVIERGDAQIVDGVKLQSKEKVLDWEKLPSIDTEDDDG